MKNLFFTILFSLSFSNVCHAETFYILLAKKDDGDIKKNDVVSAQKIEPNATEYLSYTVIKIDMTETEALDLQSSSFNAIDGSLIKARKCSINAAKLEANVFNGKKIISLNSVSVSK